MVSTRKAHKFFGNLHVFRGIDLNIAPGEVRVILGPLDSGKSTLLHCFNQLEGINAGRVSVEGEFLGYCKGVKGQFYELSNKVIAPQRSRIGVTSQRFNLSLHKTTLKNVAETPVRVAKVEKATTKTYVFELLGRVGPVDRADHYPSELSGGQQQRVAIARALIMDPEVMLFDESTSTPDLGSIEEVLQVIKNLAVLDMTMAVVTHEIDLVHEVAGTVVPMDEGQIIEMGSPAQVTDNPQEERAHELLPKTLQPCCHRPSGLLFENTTQVEERRTHLDKLLVTLAAQLDEIVLGERRDLRDGFLHLFKDLLINKEFGVSNLHPATPAFAVLRSLWKQRGSLSDHQEW